MAPPQNILVPTDFSDPATEALDYAMMLAQAFNATVHLVNAVGVPVAGGPELGFDMTGASVDSLVANGQIELDRIAEARRVLGPIGRAIVRVGDARDVILHVAEELHADLIVMGTHGRKGVSRMLLGSVAENVVRRSPCPVLTVRGVK